MKKTFARSLAGLALLTVAYAETWGGEILQYGNMREAIGQQKHQGRISIEEIVARPHFFGVAALAGLKGEVTLIDSQIIATEVNPQGRLQPLAAGPSQATLLAGSYVSEWAPPVRLDKQLEPAEVESWLASSAASAGLDTTRPFPFRAEGEFQQVRLHVINGACPMHARLNKLELPPERKPYEVEFSTLRGSLVGVYAENSVGNLTHPATSVHSHLVFTDPQTGLKVTGHVERLGLLPETELRIPKK